VVPALHGYPLSLINTSYKDIRIDFSIFRRHCLLFTTFAFLKITFGFHFSRVLSLFTLGSHFDMQCPRG